MMVQVNLNDYAERVCKEVCGYHSLFKKLYFPNELPNWKWKFLAEKKCLTDCPLTQMMCILEEDGRQMANLELEEV